MGNTVLWNTAGSIALAINYVLQGPYNTKFLTKEAATTLRINAEFFVRVDDAVFCIESDVDLTESDLDTGVSVDASTTYYVYACQPLDGTSTPVFKLSKNATYPTGGWDANNSRQIGSFDTDGSSNIDESTIADLRTVDVTLTGVEDSQIPANEISLSKLVNGTAGAFLRRSASGVVVEDPYVALQNLLTNPDFGAWSNGTLADISTVWEDDAADDDSADWTPSGSCTITFDTDHYEIATDDPNLDITLKDGALSFTKGKLYKISFDVKDGTAASSEIRTRFYDTTSHYVPNITTTAGWVTHEFIWECVTTSATGAVIWRTVADLGTTNWEIKNVIVTEAPPSCTAAGALGPDGWNKHDDLDLYRQHSDGGTLTKDGQFYSLKAVAGSANNYISWPRDIVDSAEWYEKFAGRTVTFGFWAKTSIANHVRPKIWDTTWNAGSYHTGGGAWEWLEQTISFSATPTQAGFRIYFDVNGGTAYISQPILVFGSSIGEGNYAPPQEKVIWFEDDFTSTLFDNSAFSDVAATVLNLEADSQGRIPKGIDAVYVTLSVRDSGSAAAANIKANLLKDSGESFGLMASPSGRANDAFERQSGWVPCDENGDITYIIDASGADTMDVLLVYKGVKLR